MTKKYLDETSTERKVLDYLAGMTDEYILKEFDKLKKSKEQE